MSTPTQPTARGPEAFLRTVDTAGLHRMRDRIDHQLHAGFLYPSERGQYEAALRRVKAELRRRGER